MVTAVDTNILIDILQGQSPESIDRVGEAVGRGGAVVCEAVYSEMAPLFDQSVDLDRFLESLGIELVSSTRAALHRAGQAWRDYTRRRPRLAVCPECGAEQQVRCERCRAELRFRQHTLADFLIGGHAVVHADRLLTRDRRSYARYFPELTLA